MATLCDSSDTGCETGFEEATNQPEVTICPQCGNRWEDEPKLTLLREIEDMRRGLEMAGAMIPSTPATPPATPTTAKTVPDPAFTQGEIERLAKRVAVLYSENSDLRADARRLKDELVSVQDANKRCEDVFRELQEVARSHPVHTVDGSVATGLVFARTFNAILNKLEIK